MIRAVPAVLLLAAAAAAQLVCDRPRHDFGRRSQQETVTGAFTIRNAGDTPVFIQSVTFQCLCAKGAPRERTLGAGRSTTIDFTFNTGGFEGPVRKPVTVRYGRAPVRTLQLSIGGTVVPSWTVSAETVDVGGVAPGAEIERTLDVEVTEGHEVDVTAESRSRMLSVTREPREGGRGWRFRTVLRIPRAARPGPVRAALRLKSTDARKPSFTVQVQGFVESDLRVTPRFLALGGLDPDSEVKRKVVLESASGAPFKLVEIRENTHLLVDGEIGVARARHELEVVAPKGLPPGTQRGSLIVRTDRTDEPVVRIGYSFRVRKP